MSFSCSHSHGGSSTSASTQEPESNPCPLEQGLAQPEAPAAKACGHGHHAHTHSVHTHATHEEAEPGKRKTHVNPLLVVLVLNGLYMGLEFWGAGYTHSMALLADSFHMFSDVGSLGLAVVASWWAAKPVHKPQRTFGNHRAEILAGFLNGLGLFVLAGYIAVEAFARLQAPHALLTGPLLWIALGGLLVNTFSAWWLHRPAKGGNINMQGAYLHVLGDLLGSVAAIASALGVRYLGWLWLDPVLSLLVAVLLLKSAWHLVHESSIILLEWCPRHLSIPAIEASLLEQPGVLSVHDLHVWGVGSQQWALSAHVVVEPAYTGAEQLHHLYMVLNQRYGLRHQTIQLETPDYRAKALNDGFHTHQ